MRIMEIATVDMIISLEENKTTLEDGGDHWLVKTEEPKFKVYIFPKERIKWIQIYEIEACEPPIRLHKNDELEREARNNKWERGEEV